MRSSDDSGIRLAAVDAFTSIPLNGNGAGVVLLEQPADAHWMQQLAAELNQSETAFLWADGPTWRLRLASGQLRRVVQGPRRAREHQVWADRP